MNKPHWELLHDWWVEDFEFEVSQQSAILEMIRKHPAPDDSIGNLLRDVMKTLKKREARMILEYKKIYGCRPKINRKVNK